MKCTVGSCKQNNKKKSSGEVIHYFRFPSKPEQLKYWIDFCDTSKPITKQDRICSLHFETEEFERNLKFEMGLTAKNVPRLRPDAVPSIKQPLQKESFTLLCNDEKPIIIEPLRLENETLKNVHSQSLNTIKELRRQLELEFLLE